MFKTTLKEFTKKHSYDNYLRYELRKILSDNNYTGYYITFHGGRNLLSNDKQSNGKQISDYYKAAGYSIIARIILPRKYAPSRIGYNHQSEIGAIILYKGD